MNMEFKVGEILFEAELIKGETNLRIKKGEVSYLVVVFDVNKQKETKTLSSHSNVKSAKQSIGKRFNGKYDKLSWKRQLRGTM